MIIVDETTKVIVAPKGITNLELFSLKLGDSTKSLAVAEDNIYEVRETGPYSEYDNKSAPQFPSGEPVRSLLIDNTKNLDDGAVLSNPNFITLSKFDIIFPYLQWIATRLEISTTRFQTYEDLVSGFLDWAELSQSIPALEARLKNSITRISECISENDEQFFKTSKRKINAVLALKISALKSLVLRNPDFALAKLIKGSLSDAVDDIPSKVYEQQVTRFCTDFIFSSYLGNSLRNVYDEECGAKHFELTTFLENYHARQKNTAVAAQNLASITIKTGSDNGRGNSKNIKDSKANKKQIKKVAIGKGALDQFFKRD